MTTALITPSVLLWARERAQLDPERLAQKTNVKIDKVLLWEQGQEKPTFKQAQDLARALNIPFGYLFLPHPPQETLPIPDLRTVRSQPNEQLSLDLRAVLADVLRKQDWYRDYLIQQGAEKLPFIGRFTLSAAAPDIARDLTQTMNLSLADREVARNGEDFLNLLTQKAEEIGIWVMRSGIVGNNTHRPLSVQEFRGFAIADDIAPLIFINGKDAKAAQIFTLAHELAHLWLGQSGISNPSLARPYNDLHQQVEKLCNAVAAEFLVPQEILYAHWNAQATLDDNAQQLARHFRVSGVVIARRALELGLVDWPTYRAYYQQQAALWAQPKDDQSSGGGNPYRTLPIRNGRRFTVTVVQTALGRDLLLRDAGKLLGISPAKISQLAQEIGVR